MEMLKLCVVFAVIVMIIWMKKPLYMAISGGMVAAVFCYGISIGNLLTVSWGAITSWNTISVIMGFYLITFLQRMLERRRRLKQAQEALDDIFNNRRINASIAPAVIGLLPSAAALTISAAMVEDACGEYLDKEDMTFVASFFRHIPESFLPTYTTILIALSLAGIEASAFVVAMLPMVLTLFGLGYLTMLRKVPKDTGRAKVKNKGRSVRKFFRSLWTITLIVALILIFNLPVYIATPIGIFLNCFVDKFKFSEIRPMFRSAFEPILIGNTILIMIFKDILVFTGVINLLPQMFSQLPVSPFVVFGLIFFFGTIVSGSQAIVALCMPMAIAAVPGAGLPLVVMLMCSTYAAMQLSPTHICLFIAVDYFHTSMGDLIKRTIPVIAVFCLIMSGYVWLLTLVLSGI